MKSGMLCFQVRRWPWASSYNQTGSGVSQKLKTASQQPWALIIFHTTLHIAKNILKPLPVDNLEEELL